MNIFGFAESMQERLTTARGPEYQAAPTSQQLARILSAPGPDSVTLGDLVKALNERAIGSALMICTLPALIPMPLGLASVFGIPPALIALQLLLRRDTLWLPRFVSRRRLSRHALLAKGGRFIRGIERVEHLARPRLRWAVRGAGEATIGFFVLLFALSVAVPLPLSNTIPAIGILVVALALAEEDGALAIAGIAVGVAGLAVTAAATLAAKALVVRLW